MSLVLILPRERHSIISRRSQGVIINMKGMCPVVDDNNTVWLVLSVCGSLCQREKIHVLKAAKWTENKVFL